MRRVEVAFEDVKQITRLGGPQPHLSGDERTVPFGLYTQSIAIICYHLGGHHPNVVRERRNRAPWYTTKRHCLDMIVKRRCVLIAARGRLSLIFKCATSAEGEAVV